MTEQADLVGNVASHTSLSSAEKETGIHFAGDESAFTVTTYKPTIVKSLLEHDHAEVYRYIVSTESGGHRSVSAHEVQPSDLTDETIVGCHATMPIGTLSIKSVPRTENYQSQIVTSKTIDEDAFGGDDD